MCNNVLSSHAQLYYSICNKYQIKEMFSVYVQLCVYLYSFNL